MKVYLTELAYRQILVELKKYTAVETGAILIGRLINDNFYVFESLDSGINCKRSRVIFQRDNPYSEHLADVVRAKYEIAYAIGFWHRHPGDFAQFSSVDLVANIDMARVLNREIVSGLINIIDDDISFKIWNITLDNQYKECEIIIGDQYFEGILLLKDINSMKQEIIYNEKKLFTSNLDLQEATDIDLSNHRKCKKNESNFLSKIFCSNKKEKYEIKNKEQELSTFILNCINNELVKLNQEEIICQQYITNEYKDKLLLSFTKNLINLSFDVCFFIDDNKQLFFFVDGELYLYDGQSFTTLILSKFKGD